MLSKAFCNFLKGLQEEGLFFLLRVHVGKFFTETSFVFSWITETVSKCADLTSIFRQYWLHTRDIHLYAECYHNKSKKNVLLLPLRKAETPMKKSGVCNRLAVIFNISDDLP